MIIDGNFYHKEQVEYFTTHFKDHIHIFTLKASIDTCITRDAGREKSYGEGAVYAVHSMVSRFDAGKIIHTDVKSAEEVVGEIEKELR